MKETLESINDNITTILKDNTALAQRVAELQKKYEEDEKSIRENLEAQEKKHQEYVDENNKWMKELEAQANTIRFGVGSGNAETDALRNMLPDEFKAQIPALARLKSGEPIIGMRDGTLHEVPRSNAQVEFAQADPVKYMALGAWFQTKMKQMVCGMRGEIQKADEYRVANEELTEALGGFAKHAKAALQEDTDAEGGYLVPTVLESEIGRVIKDFSVVRAAGPTIIPMTTKTHQLPTLANDFTVTLESEEATINDSAPATPFAQGSLTAKKFAGLVTVSEELIEDNVVALMDFVMTHLLELIAILEDTQALEGDGAGVNFTGLFSAAGVTDVPGGSDALTIGEIVSLIYGSDVWGSIVNGIIWAHPRILRDAFQLTTGATGTPWMLLPTLTTVTATSLFGTRVFPTGSAISRVRGGGTNETTAYHGNPRGIVLGDRTGSTFKVDPFTKMDTAQLRLRVMKRTGILVWVPARFTKLTAVTV
jgi:HK97 family phage major capsid protein